MQHNSDPRSADIVRRHRPWHWLRHRTMCPFLCAATSFLVTITHASAQSTRPATSPSGPGFAFVPGVEMAPIQKYLDRGDTKTAARAMTDRLAIAPGDDAARFQLGIVQFFQAVEHLSQTVYGFGIRPDYAEHAQELGLPLALRDNANAKRVTYADVRAALAAYVDDLGRAESTLAAIKDSKVQVRLRPGTIRLDFVGDGHPTEGAALSRFWPNGFDPGRSPTSEPTDDHPTTRQVVDTFYLKFDRGDVDWLRGYCRLLMGVSDVILAYDEHDLFDRTAQLFFKNPNTPYPFLLSGRKIFEARGVDIADVVAFVHLLHFPVADAGRMREALGHFHAVIEDSRSSWRAILAETGDDHEWIPNPNQTPAFPSLRVDRKKVDAWLRLMDEMDAVLGGKRLAPFWRGPDETVGVDVSKVFTNPQTLDPILWISGSGVAPFLSHGPHTDRKVYTDVGDAFGGDLLPFAAWFN